ncbi:predicted protein, partial [Nematostella vectensis]
MSSKYGGGPKCPKCDKTVYSAEGQALLGMTFHKRCFTCTTCNKSLDSTTVADRGGKMREKN